MELFENIDFKNDFTLSLTTVLFFCLLTIATSAFFVGLWLWSDSLIMAVVLFAILGIMLAVPAGWVLAMLSLAIAGIVTAIRSLCRR